MSKRKPNNRYPLTFPTGRWIEMDGMMVCETVRIDAIAPDLRRAIDVALDEIKKRPELLKEVTR